MYSHDPRQSCRANGGGKFSDAEVPEVRGPDGVAADALKASQHPALYCSPDKLNGDQLIDILRKWVKANRAKSPRIDKAPPGKALLYVLQDAFPSDVRSGVLVPFVFNRLCPNLNSEVS
jgi:hypothetical protein